MLEFECVLRLVASRTVSEAGRERVMALRPLGHARAAGELARVAAFMDFLQARRGWEMPAAPPVSDRVAEARVEASTLDAASLLAIGEALAASRTVRSALKTGERLPALGALAARLVKLPSLEAAIDRSIGRDGEVLDSASRELAKVRSSIRHARRGIVEWMTNFAAGLPERLAVPGASPTLREGRYVVPIRREGKTRIGGIVHDESRSGGTLFVEPPAAIELTNELRSLERAEEREIRKVLGELTSIVRPHAEDLLGALDALAELDSLSARARIAAEWRATVPELVRTGSLRLVAASHPLLLEGERRVVPLSFAFEEGERAVVVSGPNAGGKSVFLKTVGLVCSLSQSGVAPPVGPGTRVPAFTAYFADFGDEQSISRSLSTFSAHLQNIARLLDASDARSLVLLDELGAGTDPKEGSALARAVIEALVDRGATVVVSSHLGELKRLASPNSGIVNASLEFDHEHRQPTYRLVKGRPGRSYGLALAEGAGLPAGVLGRARSYVGDDEARLDEVLANLERREREATDLADELEAGRRHVRQRARGLDLRERALRNGEKRARNLARRDARELLLAARKEVEDTIRELHRRAREGADLERAARAARRRIEGLASSHYPRAPEREVPQDLPPGTEPLGPEVLSTLVPGKELVLRANAAKARVSSVRANRVVVEVGGLRLDLAPDELAVPATSLPGGDRTSDGGDRAPDGGYRTSDGGDRTSEGRSVSGRGRKAAGR